jgi:hypothetical protein
VNRDRISLLLLLLSNWLASSHQHEFHHCLHVDGLLQLQRFPQDSAPETRSTLALQPSWRAVELRPGHEHESCALCQLMPGLPSQPPAWRFPHVLQHAAQQPDPSLPSGEGRAQRARGPPTCDLPS